MSPVLLVVALHPPGSETMHTQPHAVIFTVCTLYPTENKHRQSGQIPVNGVKLIIKIQKEQKMKELKQINSRVVLLNFGGVSK